MGEKSIKSLRSLHCQDPNPQSDLANTAQMQMEALHARAIELCKQTGIIEVWEFDDGEYARHLQRLSDYELYERLRRKLMWTVSSWAGISLGLSLTIITDGLGVVVPVYSARQLFVQTRKGLLIQEEMRERNLRVQDCAMFNGFSSIAGQAFGGLRKPDNGEYREC